MTEKERAQVKEELLLEILTQYTGHEKLNPHGQDLKVYEQSPRAKEEGYIELFDWAGERVAVPNTTEAVVKFLVDKTIQKEREGVSKGMRSLQIQFKDILGL